MKHVIIGSGVAGMTAALDLAMREGTEVHLYTEEPYSYYYRPQVTNFLAGKVSWDEVFIRSRAWYEKRGIHLHLDALVMEVEPGEKRIILEDGAAVDYDRLLIATGSNPFVPPIEGVDKEGVFTLRTLEDAAEIKEYAEGKGSAVVIGGGLLGLESARGLKGMGMDVTICELFPRLLPVQLDEEGAAILQRYVEGEGYGVVLGTSARELRGEGRVEAVVLQDDREIPADVVLIATGVRPDVRLAEDAGVEVRKGILVDERMATSVPDVYAAGDAVNFKGQLLAIVVTAQEQARVAAANMAGEEKSYGGVPASTSLKVLDIDVNSMGEVHPEQEDFEGFEEVRVSDPDALTYKKIVLFEGKIVGAIVIGDPQLAKKLDRMISDAVPMTADAARSLLAGEG